MVYHIFDHQDTHTGEFQFHTGMRGGLLNLLDIIIYQNRYCIPDGFIKHSNHIEAYCADREIMDFVGFSLERECDDD